MTTWFRRLIAFVVILGFLATVKWISRPASSTAFLDPSLPAKMAMVAQALPAAISDPPAVSIVFVLDSSPNMQPRIGRDYFELAREGVTNFLSLPGFPEDGTYEISVIQYAKRDRYENGVIVEDTPGYEKGQPGYHGTYHWFGPIRVVPDGEVTPSNTICDDPDVAGSDDYRCATKQDIAELVAGIEHTEHFTGMLLESGLREADAILESEESRGDASTDYNVILLATGEYRLSAPCPPDCYDHPTQPQPPCPDSSWPTENCDDAAYTLTNGSVGGHCNRACYVRIYASEIKSIARLGTSSTARISALQLGPEYHNWYGPWLKHELNPNASDASERGDPYGTSRDYCSAHPAQPDRAGLLKELLNWQDESSANGSESNPDHTCIDGQKLGKYARMTPDVTFGDFGLLDGPLEIAQIIAKWLCEWDLGGSDTDGDGTSQGDGHRERCDNCPTTYNPRQRDCNNDGIGDVCQQEPTDCGCLATDSQEQCDAKTSDTDNDGLCFGLDQCDGGDDCLVRHWANPEECREGLEETCACDLTLCGCDCNSDGQGDTCQAAVRFRPQTHGSFAPDDPNDPNPNQSDQDVDGIPDCAEGNTPECVPIPANCSMDQSGLFTSTFTTYPAEAIDHCIDDPEIACSDDSDCRKCAFTGGVGLCRTEPARTCSEDSDCLESTCKTLVTWLKTEGWDVEPPAGQQHLHISTEAYGTSDPVNNPGRPHGSGYLEIDSRFSGRVVSSGVVLKPANECCRGRTGPCGDGWCPLIGEESFIAVDIDLLITGGGAQSWDLLIQDPCEGDCGRGARLYLRLDKAGDQGAVHLSSTPCLYTQYTGTFATPFSYTLGDWWRLRILIDNTAYYSFGGTTDCFWDAGQPTDAQNVFKLTKMPRSGDFSNPGKRYPELSDPLSSAMRGIQLVIFPSFGACSESNCNVLKIGRFDVRRTNGCEFWAPGSAPGSPCEEDYMCRCANINIWKWECNTNASNETCAPLCPE